MKVEIEKAELESLKRDSEKLNELRTEISEAQGTYDEETYELIPNEETGTDTIGEIALNVLDMWA